MSNRSLFLHTSLNVRERVRFAFKDKGLLVGVPLAGLFKSVRDVDSVVLFVRTVVDLGIDQTAGQLEIARESEPRAHVECCWDDSCYSRNG